MRRAARVDDNQEAIVKGLRAVGATVQSLAQLGKGVPDLLVGYRGQNWLFEVKDGSKPPSRRKLTPDERDWILKWRGHVFVIESLEDAYEVLGIRATRA